MTQGRCAYCDGSSIDAMGEAQIDHFHPKSREEFYELVCAWENLFLTCSACNKAKIDDWNEDLLRPDSTDFTFERYFEYRSDTGELQHNGAASTGEQRRARATIEMLKLNRPGACTLRRQVVRCIRNAVTDEETADFGYRYLIPLVRDPTPAV